MTVIKLKTGKSAENSKNYFDQLLGAQAPESWSKYTTNVQVYRQSTQYALLNDW